MPNGFSASQVVSSQPDSLKVSSFWKSPMPRPLSRMVSVPASASWLMAMDVAPARRAFWSNSDTSVNRSVKAKRWLRSAPSSLMRT